MKHAALLAMVSVSFSLPAFGQANSRHQPGNCAVWAEMTAETVRADERISGDDAKTIAGSLEAYATAQRALMERDMAKTYEQAKAFGWDKATVDAKMQENEAALRAGYRTSTMDEGKVYMDHVMAVYQCGETAKTEAELGQPATEFASAMNTLSERVQGN